MDFPTPHTVTTTRINRTDGETYAAPDTILEEEPCLIAPWSPGELRETFMGPAEVSQTVVFLAYEADVRLGDEVTDDDTGAVYVVVQPPVKYQRPTDWSKDHQQVIVRQKPVS